MIRALKDSITLWYYSRMGVCNLFCTAVINSVSIQHDTYMVVTAYKEIHSEYQFGTDNIYLIEEHRVKSHFHWSSISRYRARAPVTGSSKTPKPKEDKEAKLTQ